MTNSTTTYILLTALALVCNLTFSQTIKTKTYMTNTNGKVFVSKFVEFNKKGQLIKETECYDEKCSKVHVETRIYNEREQLIEDSIFTNKWGYHQLIWRTKYTYYDNGKLKTEKKVNEKCIEGFDDLNTYYYDKDEKLLKIYTQKACDNNLYFNYLIYFKYDSLGNQIEKIARYRDTTMIFFKNSYQYDKDNNLISDAYFIYEKDSLELSLVKEYKYDSLHRLIMKKQIYSETNADSTSYSYYKKGLLKSETNLPKYLNDRLNWIENTYDARNNLIEQQLYFLTESGHKRKGKKQLIEYEYYEN